MSRAVAALAVAALISAFAEGTLSAESSNSRRTRLSRGTPILTFDPAIGASLERISAGSALFRAAVDAVRNTGRYALILTPDEVVVTDGLEGRTSAFDPTLLAEVAPVLRDDARISIVLVVINVDLLEQTHNSKGSLPGEFHADLDRILVHEIYGHALPYLTAGDLSGRCADPQRDQRPSDACAIRRENAVRAELRLGRRVDAGLAGLALARTMR